MAEKRDKTGFGDRLRALREKKGLSQEKLGELVGMRYQAVARLERGEQTPGWDTVLKFAKALGVDVSEFVDDQPDEPDPPKRRGKK